MYKDILSFSKHIGILDLVSVDSTDRNHCGSVLEPLDKCSDAKNSQPARGGLLTGAYLLVEIRLVLQRLGLLGCSGI